MSLLTSLAHASLVGGAASDEALGAVLSASRPIVEEGDEVQFILYVPKGVEGATYEYSITGITANDLFYGTLTGNFTLDSLQGAQVSITLARDSVVEIETITMTVSSLQLSVQVTITDTSPASVGEQIYDTAGTYQWVCPEGVTSVSAVAIGPGGNGTQLSYSNTTARMTSSGGGGLGFRNNISVTPGQTYTVQVGSPGISDSYFISSVTARGGYGRNGKYNFGTISASAGGTYTGEGGGNGGSSPATTSNGNISGGGGAGGWFTSGGNGGYSNLTAGNGLNSTTGGAGGAAGYWSYAPGYSNDYGGYGGKGGGQNIYGAVGSTTLGGIWEGSSSNGNTGNAGGSYAGGNYGAGGRSAAYKGSPYSVASLAGGSGAVRIMWGEGRSFSNNAGYVAPPNGGVSVTLHQTLNNPNIDDISNDDNFSRSVAIDGNYAVVGAAEGFYPDGNNNRMGAAYVFNLTTGALLYTLDDSANIENFGEFGFSVAISGNNLIVGDHEQRGDDNAYESGKAYIFNVTTGALIHTLNNPNAYDTGAYDYFGYSVAISGNYAIVGATGEDGAGVTSSGKVYIFNVTTGELLYTLDNPNAYGTSTVDNFGSPVAISGNYAIVGTYLEDDAGGGNSGKAYIFDVTTGALLHTLNNPNAYGTSYTDQFGWSVAISGNYAVVGAPFEDDAGGIQSGKAYIFNVTTGALVHTLDNPNAYDTSLGDFFGGSVAISGNYAIVSAYAEDDADGGAYSNVGKVYIFDVATGALLHTLDNTNAYGTTVDDDFGLTMAISGNYIIVGAPEEDDASGGNSGTAYIYRLDQT